MTTKLRASKALHHDDSPCRERLDGSGYCPSCRFIPDMQSTAFHFYCSRCDVELQRTRADRTEGMMCVSCNLLFRFTDDRMILETDDMVVLEVTMGRVGADKLEEEARKRGVAPETLLVELFTKIADVDDDSPPKRG